MKKKLCEALMLDFPDGTEDFFVYCNTSAKGISCVLMEHEKVIAYSSRKLNEVEMRYTTDDLELARIVFALKILRHCLYGT